MQNRRIILALLLVLLLVVVMVTLRPFLLDSLQANLFGQPPTPVGKLQGKVGETLRLSNGLALTLVEVRTYNSFVLLHLHADNKGQFTIPFLGEKEDPQFVLIVSGSVPPLHLSDVSQPRLPAYPQLSPSSLASQTSVDGWLSLDSSTLRFPTAQLLYVFQTVPGIQCRSIGQMCQPDEGYRALIWDFPA